MLLTKAFSASLLLLITTAMSTTSAATVEGQRSLANQTSSFDRERRRTEDIARLYSSRTGEVTDVALTFDVDGVLPLWLKGTLIRNGPGQFENGNRKVLHLFDGFAKLASVRFDGNGTATFSTRFVQSSFLRDSLAGNTIAPYQCFTTVDPPFSFFEMVTAVMNGPDNMNANVYRFGDGKGGKDYVAVTDFWRQYVFSPDDLSTISRIEPELFGAQLGSFDTMSTAHPVPEPDTFNHLTILVSMKLIGPHYITLVRIRSTNEREIVASWPVWNMPYMHSLGVTTTHALLFAPPHFIDMMCLLVKHTPYDCMSWRPDLGSTVYAVELRTGKVTTLPMEAVYAKHHVNAFDFDDNNIVMDICAYEEPQGPATDFILDHLRNPGDFGLYQKYSTLTRFRIDLEQGVVTRQKLPTPSSAFIADLEMPAFNEAFRAKFYCYAYGLNIRPSSQNGASFSIVKRDLCAEGKGRSWTRDGHFASEPVFVRNPGGTDEDDGVLLVSMMEGATGKSYLAVLDATVMQLIGFADLPDSMPYTVHGKFYADLF